METLIVGESFYSLNSIKGRKFQYGHIVTVREICGYLKLGDSTIYKLALNGELPGFKIGDSWRFDMDEVIEHIEAKKETVGVKTISTRRTKKIERGR